MVKVSVIVPVYNAEQYLSRCIDSILAQFFTDFELILVNDGSTDNSLAICQSYKDKDSRVVVCNKPNGGASSARNHGIDVSKGDYICFVDADDYLNENYLLHLYQDMGMDADIDLVLHGMNRIKRETSIPITYNETRTYTLDEGLFFKDVELSKMCGPYCKLFKHDIITNNEIKFNEKIIYAEDLDFFAKYLLHCRKIRTSECKNYFYIAYEDSVSTKIYPFEQEHSGINNLFESLTSLNEKFQDKALDKQVKAYMVYYTSRMLTSIYETPRPNQSMRLKYLKSIEGIYVQIYRDYYVPPTTNDRIFKYLFVNKYYRLFDVASVMRRIKQEMF